MKNHRFLLSALLPFIASIVFASRVYGDIHFDSLKPVEVASISANPANKEKEILSSDGWATLKGRITYDGELPKGAPLTITKDEAVFLCDEAKRRGHHLDQTWLGKKTNGVYGVANVVIFLNPPKGKHFKIHKDYQDVRKDKKLAQVVLDQPFGSFDPRVVVLYPSFFHQEQWHQYRKDH